VSGTLYVVATPLGNLEDITLRALRILREVALVACEDTRRTRILLTHFGIQVSVTSYFEHNKLRKGARLLETLRAGQSVALVTDAGTPGISDPGFRLVRQAREAGVPVVPVPGPSAVVTALSAAGLPADRFVVRHPDTAAVESGVGTYGSRATVTAGNAAHMAAGKLLEEARTRAAAALRVPAEEVVYAAGACSARGRRLGLDRLVVLPHRRLGGEGRPDVELLVLCGVVAGVDHARHLAGRRVGPVRQIAGVAGAERDRLRLLGLPVADLVDVLGRLGVVEQ